MKYLPTVYPSSSFGKKTHQWLYSDFLWSDAPASHEKQALLHIPGSGTEKESSLALV